MVKLVVVVFSGQSNKLRKLEVTRDKVVMGILRFNDDPTRCV